MTFLKFKSGSGRSGAALLLVGALAGVAIGGGVGVFAASESKTLAVCVNKKTGVTRWRMNANSRKCAASETTVSWDVASGMSGTKNSNIIQLPVPGEKGATGATGATGDAGAKGDTGAPGVNGTNAGSLLVAQAVCDSADIDTLANEVCEVGMIGPSGGHIFFVDEFGKHASFDYLETAPVGWGDGITVQTGEYTGTATMDPQLKWCSNTTTKLLDSWQKSTVGSGKTNTATADATCTSGAIQVAADYAGAGQIDWYLPSIEELDLMFENLYMSGIGNLIDNTYWSSTDITAIYALALDFTYSGKFSNTKSVTPRVRPVRGF